MEALNLTDYEHIEDGRNYQGLDIFGSIEVAYQKKYTKVRNGRLSPSSGCGFCSRQAFLQSQPCEVSTNAAFEFYVRQGVQIEDIIADGLQEAGSLFMQGVRLWENEELKLGAELDLLLVEDGLIKVGEVKSFGNNAPARSRPYQLHQLLIYMAYYLIDGYMIYMSRNVSKKLTGELHGRQFSIPFDMEQAKRVIYRAAYSRHCIDNLCLPHKPNHIVNKDQCGFCSAKPICWDSLEPIDCGWFNNYPIVTINQHDNAHEFATKYVEKFFTKQEVRKRRKDIWTKHNKPLKRADRILIKDFMKMFEYEGF